MGLLFVVFTLAMLGGIPIAFAMGLASLVYLLVQGAPPLTLMLERLVAANQSFPLLAVPFFILAGELMNACGLSKRLVDFAAVLVGWVTGGLALVAILGSMFFAGVSGSAVADSAAIGSALIPRMVERGFRRGFAAAVVASAGTIGVMIPPSIPMVLYGWIANTSIGDLLLAGAVPGVLVGLTFMVAAAVVARVEGYPVEPRPTLATVWLAFRRAILALLLPLIIVGGIFFGVFTPTEAAAVGAVYAALVGLFVYRSLDVALLLRALASSAVTTGVVMFVVAFTEPFAFILTINNISQLAAELVLSVTDNPFVVLLIVNVVLLVMGTFMELPPALLIFTPVFLPIVTALGISPVQFGVIMVVNLAIGLFTPPVGGTLYVAVRLADSTIEETTRALLPFFVASVIALLLLTFFPPLSEWLPALAHHR